MKNEHYSCKYSNSLQNFVLLNLPEGNIDKYSKEYSIFCVIRNIMQRGIITPPSMLLREQLGKIDAASDKYSLSSANLRTGHTLLKAILKLVIILRRLFLKNYCHLCLAKKYI